MIKRTLRRGYNALLNRASTANKQAIQELKLTEKIDELLHNVNRIKNSTAIKTGDYEALTTLFTGQKIYVDTRDISLAPHLLLDGHWEPETTKLLRSYIRPDSVVFDIGANFGYFGLVAGANIDHTKGRLHFFEANPNLAPYIFKTLSVNGLLPVSHIVAKAVSDRPGEVELTLLNDLWGSAGINLDETFLTKNMAGREITIDERVKVPTITIDDYIKEQKIKHVDVIKIDIEGHEEAAYKGMRKTVKKSPSLKMFLEFTDDAYTDAKKFFEQLQEDFGNIYAISNKGGGTLIPVHSYAAMKKLMTDRWIMLVASKEPLASTVATGPKLV